METPLAALLDQSKEKMPSPHSEGIVSETMDASGKNKRVTMIKSVVGKVKSAQYALPDIVYGVESKLDKEGAKKGEISLLLVFLS